MTFCELARSACNAIVDSCQGPPAHQASLSLFYFFSVDSSQLFASASGDPDNTLRRLAQEMVADSRPVTSTVAPVSADGPFDGSLLGADETVESLSRSAVVSETGAVMRALSSQSIETVEPSVASLLSALSQPSRQEMATDHSRPNLSSLDEESPLPGDWSRDVQRIASSLTGLGHYLSTNQSLASAGMAHMSAPAATGIPMSSIDYTALASTASPPLPNPVSSVVSLGQVRMVPGQEGEAHTGTARPLFSMFNQVLADANDNDRFPLPGQEHSPSGSVSDTFAGNRPLGEGEDSEGDQASLFRNYLNPSDAGLLLAQYIASQQQQALGQAETGGYAGGSESGTSSPVPVRSDYIRDSRRPLSSPLGSSRVGGSSLCDSDGSLVEADNATPAHISSHSLSGVSDFMDDQRSDSDDAQCGVPRTEGVGISPNQSDLTSSMEADATETPGGEANTSGASGGPWLESLRQGPSGQPYDRPDVLGEVNVQATSAPSAASNTVTVVGHSSEPPVIATALNVSADVDLSARCTMASPLPNMMSHSTDSSRPVTRSPNSPDPHASMNEAPKSAAIKPFSRPASQHVLSTQADGPMTVYSGGVSAANGASGISVSDKAPQSLLLAKSSVFEVAASGPLDSRNEFEGLLQGNGSFYSQLGFDTEQQLDEDFVPAEADIGEMLDAAQDENAREYQFDPAFDHSLGQPWQQDFSQGPLQEQGMETTYTVGATKPEPAQMDESGGRSPVPRLVASPDLAKSTTTPQKVLTFKTDQGDCKFSPVHTSKNESGSDHQLQVDASIGSFQSDPSPSAYFAARSSVLGGLDDVSGGFGDNRVSVIRVISC